MLARVFTSFQIDIYFWLKFLGSGKISQCNVQTEYSEATGTDENTSNFVFTIQIAFKSIISICMLFVIFIIFCSLCENRFINAKMHTFSLAQSQKRLSSESGNNLIFSVPLLKLTLSTEHPVRCFKTKTGLYSHFLTARWTVSTPSWTQWYHLLKVGNTFSCLALWYSDDWDG